MWTTAALVTALSLAPGHTGPLALTNVRTTYGVLGPVRPDNRFLPGDTLVLSFDIEGVRPDDGGRVLYRIGMEVADGTGKVRFKQDPRDLEANCSLGGDTVPAVANLHVGLNQPPGEYTVKVTVTDRATGATQTLTRRCELLPPGFGLVGLNVSADPDGRVAAPFPGKGQSVWVNFAAVGFERDKTKDRPDCVVTLRLLDEKGRPTLARPYSGEINQELPQSLHALPMNFVLDLNRAGKFTAELKATDKVSGKTAALSFPLTVLGEKP